MKRTSNVLLAVVLVCALVCVADYCHAAGGLYNSRTRRLVAKYDFEETDEQGRKIGYGHPMPKHWYAIGRNPLTRDPNFHRQDIHRQLIHRPGFPHYAEVGFDSTQVHGGDFSLHLGLNGGNAGTFLEVGALPVVPSSDYLVTAHVMTKELDYASAGMTVYFVDDQGRLIPESMRRTELVQTGGRWLPFSLKLQGDYPGAVWIGMELELLQPEPVSDHPLGEQQVLFQDIHGGAWFDDISVWQLPHVEVVTQSRVNIIRMPLRPKLTIRVKDLSGQRLHADVGLYDHNLRQVGRISRKVGDGAPNWWEWEPDLPGFGWYLVDMQVFEKGDRRESIPNQAGSGVGVGDDRAGSVRGGSSGEGSGGDSGGELVRTFGAFLWLPKGPETSTPDRNRFSLVADSIKDEEYFKLLPQLLDSTSLKAIVISPWREDHRLSEMEYEQKRLSKLLQPLMSVGRQMTMALTPLPMELAQSRAVDPSRTLAALSGPPELWVPYLAPVLRRHGQQVQQWQLGSVLKPEAVYFEGLPEIIERIQTEFLGLAPYPTLLLPWRLDQSRPAGLPESLIYAVDVPVSVMPEYFDDYLEEWQSPASSVWLYLREPAADELSHRQRMIDLVLRMLYAWRNEVDGMAIADLWTEAVERRKSLVPDPLLGVFSNTAHRLANRRMIGWLPLREGLKCMIFDGEAGGMLVAWNRSTADSVAYMNMYLGEQPVVVDVWGNRTVLKEDAHGRHYVKLDKLPVFIEQIDPELAVFRSKFTVTPEFIPSMQMAHKRVITLENPWPRTISGSLLLTGPEDWMMQPDMHYFSIPSGGELTLPLTLSFPVSEVAGFKYLTAEFDFIAHKHYKVDMGSPMELGLQDVEFQATMAILPGKKPGMEDVYVNCVITNTGSVNQSLYVYAYIGGHPRQERLVARIEPGQSVVRTFKFENAGEAIRKYPLRTGVRESNGPVLLNKILTPEDPR